MKKGDEEGEQTFKDFGRGAEERDEKEREGGLPGLRTGRMRVDYLDRGELGEVLQDSCFSNGHRPMNGRITCGLR